VAAPAHAAYQVPWIDTPFRLLGLTTRQWGYALVAFEVWFHLANKLQAAAAGWAAALCRSAESWAPPEVWWRLYGLWWGLTHPGVWQLVWGLGTLLACGALGVAGALLTPRGRGAEHWFGALAQHRVTPEFAVWSPGAALWEGDD
jgi:hypothetical protein